MDWQTIIAGIIGFVAFGLLGRWLYRLFTGRDRGGCAACDDLNCPLRNHPSRSRKSACPESGKRPPTDDEGVETAQRPKNRCGDF